MMKAMVWPTLDPTQTSAVPASMPKTAPAAMAMTMAGNISTTPAVYTPCRAGGSVCKALRGGGGGKGGGRQRGFWLVHVARWVHARSSEHLTNTASAATRLKQAAGAAATLAG